jgi:hypothetical protein
LLKSFSFSIFNFFNGFFRRISSIQTFVENISSDFLDEVVESLSIKIDVDGVEASSVVFEFDGAGGA